MAPSPRSGSAVQRSAAPEAYARWEAQSRVLAQALTGEVPGAFSCRVSLPKASVPSAQLTQAMAAEIGTMRVTEQIDALACLGVDPVRFQSRDAAAREDARRELGLPGSAFVVGSFQKDGVGWGEGVVGNATVGADLDSPAGYALHTGKPVISNHLENEERFRTPELLVEHGIRRAMNVILQGDGLPFGVLEVDSRSEGEFGEHDIAFLQGAANILGMAIEQQQYQRKLQAALDRHQILLKEVNHRVKNSLQVVSSMLHLQANAVGDPALSERLMEASTRILAVGRAYNRLAYNADYENIDLVAYLREVVEDLEAAVAPCKIELDTPKEIQFAADRAILVALIVNELILNAGRHAYPDSPDGLIRLQLVLSNDKAVSISVSDDGVGLPADFNPALTKRLGTRIVQALAGQLGAELTRQQSTGGTHLTLVVPLHAAAN